MQNNVDAEGKSQAIKEKSIAGVYIGRKKGLFLGPYGAEYVRTDYFLPSRRAQQRG